MGARKSWHDRLHDDKNLPEIKPIPARMRKRSGVGTIVIPAPREVDAVMRSVPQGKLITVQTIAARVAVQHDATIGCAVTTGIFAWIAANAADEAEAAGAAKITPYWRVVKTNGELNPKYPGGIRNLKSRLEAEGHQVVRVGEKYWVQEAEAKLVEI
jgi:alkylated DNA nucleotide flippase Atl1